MRSWSRNFWQMVSVDRTQVHHFLPGIVLAIGSGTTRILRGRSGWRWWLSLLFGAGVALVMDEVVLLMGRQNAYWRSEKFAFAQASAAALGAGALGVRLYRRRGASIIGHR